jgi:hypothetical protein
MKDTIQLFLSGVLIVLLVMLDGVVIIGRHKIKPGPTQYSATPVNPCLQYIELSAGLAFSKQRETIALHTYSVSDGRLVYATYYYYRSPKKAKRELNRRLSSAIRTITRETKLDERGHKTGVRAIGIFRSGAAANKEFQVLWTDGSDLNIIRGPSLSHVLQLEKPNCH